jgi:hypothetical protein
MNALALAKRRAALRRSEDGAVMFIVAMTLAVLASVGIYALAAAATEVKTSGNERQNTQTHYLAEYGVVGMANWLGSLGDAQSIYQSMKNQPDTNCVSLPGLPVGAPQLTAACMRKGSVQLGTKANWQVNPPITAYGSPNAYAGTPPGSLGTAPIYGDFFVELTEPLTLAKPAGMSTNSHVCPVQVTATSVGFTQPGTQGMATVAAILGGEGVEIQRARLIAKMSGCP